ncbi:MAG: ECF-type sigma factor [Planctomycetota bacterium]|nr:ECF-type sigma factor [Planctomycetota bacterium]
MNPKKPQAKPGEVTRLLQSIGEGNQHAAADLLPLVYAELRRLAASRMAHLPPGQTLQPTALVHDVYLELVGQEDPGWNSRAHFFGAAAQAMREILVDQARRKSRRKHGGDRKREVLADDQPAMTEIEMPPVDVLALDEALDRMKTEHPRRTEVLMLRFFAGLSAEQTAEVLKTSARTIERDWQFARVWLHRELST